MHLTDIRIDEIVNVTHLPCYARGRATFDNGRSYPFDANFAHGYGDAAVVVYSPANGKELKSGTRVHKAIMDRLGFPDIAQRERDAVATFEEERVAACRALMRRRPS